jgi:SpoVK/Ycf46/Vps4 family AAA+-type ATPase
LSKESIKSLETALSLNPENLPLRLHLAELYLAEKSFEKAETCYQEAAKYGATHEVQKGLAKVYFEKGEYSTAIVILEDYCQTNPKDEDALYILAQALFKDGAEEQSGEIYRQLIEVNPEFVDEELDSQFRQPNLYQAIEDELEDLLSPFSEQSGLSFEDVGGMDAIKKEIDLKIIRPIKHPEIYKAYGKKAGGGILLYGPPGCGKTFLAKATAGEIDARFISVGLNDILDMWIGNSEKNLHNIFEIARDNQPCVLFLDEVDALGANRSDMKQSAGRQLINQFLLEMDNSDSANEGVLILGATNTPWHLDEALRRPGRFDRILFVPPPDLIARERILELKLKEKPTERIDFQKIAKKTDGYSGADLEAVVDLAIEEKLEASFEDGQIRKVSTKDLLNAVKRHKPTTAEWFEKAKNFALYSNQSGLYNDILDYLKIKK